MHPSDLAQIEQALARTSAADGDRWRAVELQEELLYLTRSAEGAPGLFILGTHEDFAPYIALPGVSFSDSVIVEPEGRTISALRILSAVGESAERVVVHLAAELVSAASLRPRPSVTEIVGRSAWLIALFGMNSELMSPERQRGLVGELQLLARLVRRAQERGVAPKRAIECWVGASGSKRDYRGGNIAIEVKTTSEPVRRHSIGSISQLEPHAEGEVVYIYSVGVRQDQSAPRRLTHFVRDVEVLLDPEALAMFRARLAVSGVPLERREAYALEPGFLAFHLVPQLFAVKDVERLQASSFAGGGPPPTVSDISYRLLITADPIPRRDEEQVLDALLATQ